MELRRTFRAGGLAYGARLGPGELPFRPRGKPQEEVFPHDQIQYGIAQKFQPFIVMNDLIPVLVHLGRMGERRIQELDILDGDIVFLSELPQLGQTEFSSVFRGAHSE